jgi:DNA repair protein RAD16
LPFQKESLYWMRKQEEGPWKGGMLADESECFLES